MLTTSMKCRAQSPWWAVTGAVAVCLLLVCLAPVMAWSWLFNGLKRLNSHVGSPWAGRRDGLPGRSHNALH